jgi:hypothetical protein
MGKEPVDISLPRQKLIGFPQIFVIFSVSQHQYDAIKNWRWSMKVSKAVNLFLDYQKLNSQKKYGQGLRLALGQIQGPFS